MKFSKLRKAMVKELLRTETDIPDVLIRMWLMGTAWSLLAPSLFSEN